MTHSPASPTPSAAAWWLLPSIDAGGAWQMACDSWLLQRAVAGCREPVLRFYRWSRPTLSLGFHQRRLEPHWRELAASGRIDLVRRPSGGRAVLHAGSLTYALIWPEAPSDRLGCYRRACSWLQAGFAALGQPLQFGGAGAGGGAGGGGGAVADRRPGAEPPPSCFALGSAADLCHADGAKRIGSAQLRRHGQLLQHGSILVDPPAGLWRELFGAEPPVLPPLPWSATAEQPEAPLAALEAHLIATARRLLPALLAGPGGKRLAEEPGPRQDPLGAAEQAAIARLCRRAAAVQGEAAPPAGAGSRVTSPVATMVRATWPSGSPSG